MNIKFFNFALCIVLTAITISARAQKNYTQGVISTSIDVGGKVIKTKNYFTPDSLALTLAVGPASIKVLKDSKDKFLAISEYANVAFTSIKKAAIATPDYIEQVKDENPQFIFTPSTEIKQISGFNCKKVVATDTKTNQTYDIWVTNDVTLPANAVDDYYAAAGGVPIQYATFSRGQSNTVTVTSIKDNKIPAGTFTIPPDFDKTSMDQLIGDCGFVCY